MSPVTFTNRMAEFILEKEDTSQRFERFCVDLFTEVDGVQYVPTSASWDLGRDGRPVSLHSANAPVLCASLRPDVDTKITKDVARLVETTNPKVLRFCSTQRITEYRRDEIVNLLHRKFHGIEEILVDGCTQLAVLAGRHPAHLHKWYRGELDNLRDTLLAPDEQQWSCPENR